MTTIGQLRDLVLLQRPQDARDDRGDVVVEWITMGEAWAQVRAIGGQETWLAQQVQSTATHRVRMRWDPRITSDWRLKMGAGRIFNIVSGVPAGERGEWLDLLVSEVAI
jgi:SPP1 family predicted phage head-tail adaptor